MRILRSVRLVVFALSLVGLFIDGPAQAQATNKGRFEGSPLLEDIPPDYTEKRIVRPFAYIDPSGTRWEVKVGLVTDGASVPPWARPFLPPHAGKYLWPAYVHDQYCKDLSRPDWAVHEMFYNAMITAGVDWKQAKLMYWAVLFDGPRWRDGVRTRSLGAEIPEADRISKFKEMKSWIDANDPDLEAIERRARELARSR